MASRPHVLTIPASRPFLPTLAQAILDGRVLPGWPDRADPLSFAGGTILMPNRRTCRELRAVFAEEMGAALAAFPIAGYLVARASATRRSAVRSWSVGKPSR